MPSTSELLVELTGTSVKDTLDEGWRLQSFDFRRAVKSLGASTPPALQLDCARAFCAEAVAAYWFHLENRPQSPLRPPPSSSYRLGREGELLALRLGNFAAGLNVDDASFAIGSAYSAMLPDGIRARQGVFYTPPPLVNYLLERVEAAGIDWSTARVLDPACGGGAFLSPVLRRLASSLKSSHRRVALRSIESRLRGQEIDPFSSWLSLVFFDVTMHEEFGFSDNKMNPVRVCNSLELKADGPIFDLVVGNPPYGRVRLSRAEREDFSRGLFGHANLYGLFLDLAVSWAAPKGVIAYVAPTSFLCGEYYKRLRKLLADKAPLQELNLIEHRSGVFDSVLQETLLAIFRPGRRASERVNVNLIELADNKVNKISEAKAYLPQAPDQPWIIPRSREATALVERLSSAPHRLSDWGYKVSTGPLVWNRLKDRLRERPSSRTVPLIWAEAVSPDGVFRFRALRRNHSPYFAIRSDDDPVLVRKPCVLLKRTTSKEQPRRLVAAELPTEFLQEHGAVAVENHLNMIVPIVEKPAVDTQTLTAFLSSDLADRVFRCISGTVAVSAYELEAMPLPDPSKLKGGLPGDLSKLYPTR